MKNRLLIAILLPVVSVGVILAVWATNFMVPPLLSFIQNRTDASLKLIARLGLERCESNFNYLLDLRLEDDQSMTRAMKQDTLLQVGNLSGQFDQIHLFVMDAQGDVVGKSPETAVSPAMDMHQLNISGDILDKEVFGQRARCIVRYFPVWRWYVVAYIFEKDYEAPILLARKIIFVGTGVVLLAVILTAGMVFHFRVYQPLQRIINAAEKIAGGHFQAVATPGNDEISRVTAAFNSMVDSLAKDQAKINQILSALRRSEEMYRVITENSLSQIILVQNGRIIFANRRALEMMGYSADEILNRPALSHIHTDDHAKVRRMARNSFLRKQNRDPVECRYFTKYGDMRWVELAVVRTGYKGEPVLLAHGIDVTRRREAFEDHKKLEDKLRQAQKMEAIGTLAGGIAHDFNNLLMGIQGNVSLLKLGGSKADRMQERLFNIEQYIKNGAELTRQLLGYARGGKYQVRTVRINKLVQESATMFGRTKKEIVITFDLDAKDWSVEVDRGQIEQVLLNLYVNAWQAMPGGGELHIYTEGVSLQAGVLRTFPEKPGDFILIKVTDTGIGMDEQTLQKIFDPFFTTKQRERGTGLGLASAYGIIKNHDGLIYCDSKPKKGTTFYIYLPRSSKQPTEILSSSETIKGGFETVLLVDDEQMVLEVGCELLEYLGYKTITASSGRAALEIFTEKADSIDLVILDMVMPEIGGKETFEALRKIRGDIPVLLCSGYSLSGPASELMARGCNGFIQKPFDVDVLSKHLRRLLDKEEAVCKTNQHLDTVEPGVAAGKQPDAGG